MKHFSVLLYPRRVLNRRNSRDCFLALAFSSVGVECLLLKSGSIFKGVKFRNDNLKKLTNNEITR